MWRIRLASECGRQLYCKAATGIHKSKLQSREQEMGKDLQSVDGMEPAPRFRQGARCLSADAIVPVIWAPAAAQGSDLIFFSVGEEEREKPQADFHKPAGSLGGQSPDPPAFLCGGNEITLGGEESISSPSDREKAPSKHTARRDVRVIVLNVTGS
ncbi:hypothetical protein AOLI_G00190120 [Acnodon oligacanthus]